MNNPFSIKQAIFAFMLFFLFSPHVSANSFANIRNHIKKIKPDLESLLANRKQQQKAPLKKEPKKIAVTPFIVTTTADNGDNTNPISGSLRDAIIQLNTTGLYDAIYFNIKKSDSGYDSLTNTWTIKPLNDLPNITKTVTIDGYEGSPGGATPNTLEQGDNAVLTIVLNGSNYTVGDGITTGIGLYFDTGSDNSIVRGLVINQWLFCGILIEPTIASVSGIQIIGNFFGTNAKGTQEMANQIGIGLAGLTATVFNTNIGTTNPADRNIFAGSFAASDIGSAIISVFNTETSIVNNYIGTDKTGTLALGNSQCGIHLTAEFYSSIGGTSSGSRNIISGQSLWGIVVIGSSQITIQGNYIGTDVSGTNAVGNQNAGLYMFAFPPFPSTQNTIIDNVFSGNGTGIRIGDSDLPGTTLNSIQGNLIGTDFTGTKPLPNTFWGIIVNDAQNTIGGSAPDQFNLISGNTPGGILVYGSLASENLFSNNLIGTDITGTKILANNGNGVQIGLYGGKGGSSNNTFN